MLQYFLIASLAVLLTHVYFGARLFAASTRRRAFRRALVANWALLPAAMVLTLRAPASMARWSVPIAHVTFFDLGFCILLLAGLLVRDLGLALAWVAAAAIRRARARRDPPADAPSRRQVLRRALDVTVVGAAGAASVAGYGLALADPVLRRVRIPVAASRVPPGWRGLRVVQVSDLHVGPTIRRAYVEALVAKANSLSGDLVVITGDLVDGFVEQLRDQVEPLRRLRAPHGVWFVTGNHEYFYRAHEWVAALRALGVEVLANSHRILEHEGARILLAGLDDPNADERGDRRHGTLARAMSDAPACALRILLAHRPGDAPEAARRGFDVQLSGHMHGGQFAPLTWILQRTERFVGGLYREKDMWLYVNQGAGYWGPPNRLGARQEIAVIEVTPT